MTTTPLQPTARTSLRRSKERAATEREALYDVLRNGMFCHLGVVVDGDPLVLPTAYGVDLDRGPDGTLYLHGSVAARSVVAAPERTVCVTVTHADGLVLARSAFHHSVNYRSAVVLGRARLVTDLEEKRAALRQFTNHVVPGRWDEVRPITDQEIRGTAVLALPIEEASAKVRTGPPLDDAEDLQWPVWAGVVPLSTTAGDLVPDAQVLPGVTPFDRERLRERGRS